MIIENKLHFMNDNEERKEKQRKIAFAAKNDNQDKTEVVKRKLYFFYKLYNKYLRMKMKNELIKNVEVENIMQKLKKITGAADVERIISKVENRKKDYNFCIIQVKYKEQQILDLKQKLKQYEDEHTLLKTESAGSLCEDKVEENNPSYSEYEKEENEDEEHILKEDLKNVRLKHNLVTLAYDNIISNINLNYKKIQDDTHNESAITKAEDSEEMLLEKYIEFLNRTKENIQNNYLNKTKEQYIEEVSKNKYLSLHASPLKQKNKKRQIQAQKEEEEKEDINNYEYNDTDMNREDQEIQKDTENILKEFKDKIAYKEGEEEER